MSYSDGGGRSIRKSSNRSPKELRVTKAENSDKTTTSISYGSHHCHHHHRRFVEAPQPSVHKRNLYIVSLPLILLFNVLRVIIYQLFVVFEYLYTSTSRLIKKKQAAKSSCQLEVVVDKETAEEMSKNVIRRPVGPGPGDPLLAKQKHHHRRAFEYISKALKIDEENES